VKESKVEEDKIREELEAEIAALLEARDESDNPDERAAATQAIDVLQDKVDRLDIGVADNLGDMVDEIIEKLDEVLDANSLDAVSALGRTIRRLRDLRRGPAGAD
jgi:chromosome condensin MukBEF ATPase and DNA-binding subunit MukB